jgi:nucleotide-binding universal stress UspA family protein
VRWAAEEARRRGLPLTLVHAWKEPLEVAVELEEFPGYDATAQSRAEQGRAAAVLLGRAAELLVLGGHSPHVTHATRLVLHHASCPVVVVPDEAAPASGRVVVGVTPNDHSRAPLRWAADAAAMRHAVLVVVHAWQVHQHSAWDVFHPAVAAARQEAGLRVTLEEWVRDHLGRAGPVEMRTRHGGPLDVLLDAARGADLLVLGRSAHRGLGRLLHAAVSDDAAGLAGCPVAVVPDQTPHGRPRVSV